MESTFDEGQDKRRYYTQNEVANKLGLSEQIITRMCEHGKFNGAKSIEGKSGQWLIPKENFVTTNEQDDIAENVLQTIDIKNKKTGDVDEFDL